MIISPEASPVSTTGRDADDREALRSGVRTVRLQTEELCRPLLTEDYGVQTMPNVSPPKWHLAHTTWFFERFILVPFQPGYRPFHPQFDYLFNSYYETIGTSYPRPRRSLLSRPSVAQVYRYRAYVDEAMGRLIDSVSSKRWDAVATRTVIGLHHEQQHQELLLTDIKHILGNNPLRPVYRDSPPRPMQRRQRSSGSNTRAALFRSVIKAPDSRSITKRRDTAFCLNRSASPRSRLPMASMRSSLRRAPIRGRNCGSPTVGTR